MVEGKLIVIASSTGGPKILVDIFSRIDHVLPASVIVVQHMLPRFITSFANRINNASKMNTIVGTDGLAIEEGVIIVAPGKRHLVVAEGEDGDAPFLILHDAPPHKGVIPAADFTMISAARIYKAAMLGVIITGMGKDGTDGFAAVKENGGMTLVQDRESSAVFGMPGAAIKAGLVDKVLTPAEIAEEIVRFSWEVD
ncbi:MAG: chemotaxis protein CheB [Deltaproteobacteria bacterium]|nr:chemotaxis protein CheB [Candidatus Zymogenaceae bacterium]